MTTQTFIGPYRVVETIGRGGFATVYRCVDDRLEAEVAIKVLADNHAADPDIRLRFLAEGRILRKIDNRHLAQVHDVGETDRDQPYLVLELASSGDLRSRVAELQKNGWVPTWDDVQHLADALLDAAGALHNSELVHRDLSPANVLIRSTSQRPPSADISIVGADERLLTALGPALSTNPADRPETAAEMNEIVTLALQDNPRLQVGPPTLNRPGPPR